MRGTIPIDPEAVNRSINQGRPLAETAPRHPVCQAIRSLGAGIVGLEIAEEVSPRLGLAETPGGEVLAMSLVSRLKEKARPPGAEQLPPAPPAPRAEALHDLKDLKKEIVFNDLKSLIHARIIHLLDLTRLAEAPENSLMEDLRRGIEMILAEEKLALTLAG